MRCRDLQGFANLAFLSGFLCSGLLHVAPYCVPGGVRVVLVASIRALFSVAGVSAYLAEQTTSSLNLPAQSSAFRWSVFQGTIMRGTAESKCGMGETWSTKLE